MTIQLTPTTTMTLDDSVKGVRLHHYHIVVGRDATTKDVVRAMIKKGWDIHRVYTVFYDHAEKDERIGSLFSEGKVHQPN
ncbi:MAG: hypothetical protein D6746_16075, partial [Bacteroidetes bacterium]